MFGCVNHYIILGCLRFGLNEVKLQCIKQEKFCPVCFVLGAGIQENNILGQKLCWQ